MQKRGKPENRAQAAMEFLMTYGWAIMVALVAIGALSYFGILSPDKLVPRRCALEPGIGCMDFRVDEDSVVLMLQNGRGEDVDISDIKISSCTGTASGNLNNGEQKNFMVGGCGNTAGEKFIGQVNITFSGETGLVHKNRGNVVSKAEEGCSQCACENTDDSCGTYPDCSNCNYLDAYSADYCSGNNVVRDFNDYSCSSQQCALSALQELVEDCTISGKICEDGGCVEEDAELTKLICEQYKHEYCTWLFWLCDSICTDNGYDRGELSGFCYFSFKCKCYDEYETQCSENPSCGSDAQIQQVEC